MAGDSNLPEFKAATKGREGMERHLEAMNRAAALQAL